MSAEVDLTTTKTQQKTVGHSGPKVTGPKFISDALVLWGCSFVFSPLLLLSFRLSGGCCFFCFPWILVVLAFPWESFSFLQLTYVVISFHFFVYCFCGILFSSGLCALIILHIQYSKSSSSCGWVLFLLPIFLVVAVWGRIWSCRGGCSASPVIAFRSHLFLLALLLDDDNDDTVNNCVIGLLSMLLFLLVFSLLLLFFLLWLLCLYVFAVMVHYSYCCYCCSCGSGCIFVLVVLVALVLFFLLFLLLSLLFLILLVLFLLVVNVLPLETGRKSHKNQAQKHTSHTCYS